MYQSTRVMILVIVGLVLAGWTAAQRPAESKTSVFAIGDVHGDFEDFVAILQHTGLVDKQNHWAAGKTTFVQTGDLLDRGPKPREVMDLEISLEKEAANDGGRLVQLLGNHEVMNIMGDLRYVTPGNFASFADAKSEERRKSAFSQYQKWHHSHAEQVAELPQPMELTEAEWMARHPAGFVEQREAFGPEGTYGKWLRKHDAIAEINGSIFLHGGISPAVSSIKLDAINSRIHDEIRSFDSLKQFMVDRGLILPFFNLQEITAIAQAEISAANKSKVRPDPELQEKIAQFLHFPEWLSVRADGPVWFRGYDQWNDEEGNASTEKILQSLGATHVVVGHTVQKGGSMRARFGGKVFLIDTGMLSSVYVGGRPSALEIQNSTKFTAQYMEQQVVLLQPAEVSHLLDGSEPRRPVKNFESIIATF